MADTLSLRNQFDAGVDVIAPVLTGDVLALGSSVHPLGLFSFAGRLYVAGRNETTQDVSS
jgi:hypothetical protein